MTKFDGGNVIREHRKVLGISQIELVADIVRHGVNMNQTRLSRIEACNVIPKPKELEVIISLLGIDRQYFMECSTLVNKIITYSENRTI